MKTEKCVHIDGGVIRDTNDIEHDLFLDRFIEFIEANGWCFMGVTNEAEMLDERKNDDV
jgi:uncharacterized protein YggL (DUF469 family)